MIMIENFKDMVLGVLWDNWWYEVTLNLTQPHLTSFVMTYHDLATQFYISVKNQDKDTKLSGYDPWGLPSTSITPKPCLLYTSPSPRD